MAGRSMIQRTINVTTLKSVNVAFKDGKLVPTENKPIIINGEIKEEKATKLIRKAYGLSAQLQEISCIDSMYEISIEDFVKYGKKVEPKQEGTNANQPS